MSKKYTLYTSNYEIQRKLQKRNHLIGYLVFLSAFIGAMICIINIILSK